MQQSSGTDITSKEIPNATLVIMQWYHFLATLRIPLAKSRLISNARLLIVHQTKWRTQDKANEVILIGLGLTFTLKCLSIGTPKAINFPFVSNEKLMFLGVPVF